MSDSQCWSAIECQGGWIRSGKCQRLIRDGWVMRGEAAAVSAIYRADREPDAASTPPLPDLKECDSRATICHHRRKWKERKLMAESQICVVAAVIRWWPPSLLPFNGQIDEFIENRWSSEFIHGSTVNFQSGILTITVGWLLLMFLFCCGLSLRAFSLDFLLNIITEACVSLYGDIFCLSCISEAETKRIEAKKKEREKEGETLLNITAPSYLDALLLLLLLLLPFPTRWRRRHSPRRNAPGATAGPPASESGVAAVSTHTPVAVTSQPTDKCESAYNKPISVWSLRKDNTQSVQTCLSLVGIDSWP